MELVNNEYKEELFKADMVDLGRISLALGGRRLKR
jgi:hypothetical protein